MPEKITDFAFESPNIKAIILQLMKNFFNKDGNILTLTIRVDYVEKRTLECEKYGTKDCIILINTPFKNN